MYYIYLLRCADGALYTGITTDPERRLHEHREKTKKAAKSTRAKTVLGMVCIFEAPNRGLASKLEYWIKKLTKAQKEQLIQTKSLAVLQEKIDTEQYFYFGEKMS